MICRIKGNSGPIRSSVHLPASKSLSNRALIIRAQCQRHFEIHNLSTAQDTVVLQKLLNSGSTTLDVGDAGTVMRFLTALLAGRKGEFLLTGSDRMQQRPIGPLVAALQQLGAVINYPGKTSLPPLKIQGQQLSGGQVQVAGNVSSQFVSALLMVAPGMKAPLQLELTGKVTSTPYIDMTLKMMAYFGVAADWEKSFIQVQSVDYQPQDFTVENDWSAAAFWYELVALSAEADLLLPHLLQDSWQGDQRVVAIFEMLGVHTAFTKGGVQLTKQGAPVSRFEYDFSDCPDLAQPVAATCAGLGIEATLTGLHTLPDKETDRIQALKNELQKLGAAVQTTDHSIHLSGGKVLQKPAGSLEVYGDHRMAMALAPLALKVEELVIKNAEVVQKSYPHYWEDLQQVGFSVVPE